MDSLSHEPTKREYLQGRTLDLSHEADDCPARSAYSAVVAAAAVLFIGVGYTNAFGVFENYYHTTLFPAEAPDKIITIGSTAASLYLILGAVTGRFADVFGYRVSLLLGSSLMVGALFAASASTKFYQLLLSQGVMFGLGVAFVYGPATSISRQLLDPGKAGIANGVVVSGGAFGGFILPFVFRILIERRGLPATFRISAYIAIGVLIPAIIFLKPNVNTQRRTGVSKRKLLDLSLLQNPKFLVVLLCCMTAMVGFLPRYFLLPTSAEAKGVGQEYSAWLLGMMNGFSIVGRIGVGIFAARYGPILALSMSFLLCGLGHLAFWLPAVAASPDHQTATALFTTFVVYIGLFGSGFISLFPTVTSHLFGKDDLASKTGLLNTAIGIATLPGPSIIYAIIGDGTTKRWAVGVLVSGLPMIVGGGLLWVAWRISYFDTEEVRQFPDSLQEKV